MKKIVVFTGAGVSADSGLATFRDSDGLWANYRIEDVCTPEALRDNRAQVVDFYNMRCRVFSLANRSSCVRPTGAAHAPSGQGMCKAKPSLEQSPMRADANWKCCCQPIWFAIV
jgi:hypothetical protein